MLYTVSNLITKIPIIFFTCEIAKQFLLNIFILAFETFKETKPQLNYFPFLNTAILC